MSNMPNSNALKVLFICTHNRCRSILCEAIANQTTNGKLHAVSAGSTPSGVVHPLTLKHLEKNGFSIEGLQSQSWDEHENFDADVVFTVCDSAAGESCPVWFGKSIKAHWGLNDPSKLADDEEKADKAFTEVIETIKQRMQSLAKIAELNNEQSLTQSELVAELQKIGVHV